jgi:hypothetical protein
MMLMQSINVLEVGLDMAIQSFVNRDGTVDGELRIGGLPEAWKDPEGFPELIATLSNALGAFRPFDRNPSFGGSFWFSIGVRFGAQNESEFEQLAALYKQYKGLLQIGTYPVRADHVSPMQICLTDDRRGLRGMISALAEKRGLPPSTILIRFTWGEDWHPEQRDKRPGHYKGEKGEKGQK